MARWRLTNAHYIMATDLDGQVVEWEYTETNRTSGRPTRLRFKVPIYLDPKDPSCHNYPDIVVVSNRASPAFPRDYVFKGDPTPDMFPLDAEAEKISKSLADSKWHHPIETLDGNFSASMLKGFEQQLASAISKAGGIPNAAVNNDRVTELEKQLAALTAQLALVTAAQPTGK